MDWTYDDGVNAAMREIKVDHWTPTTAAQYVAHCEAFNCADGRDDYDRGFMDTVKAFAARAVLS